MIESIKRFYSNSFIDAQRQDAINLFLGNYVWERGKPMLWDLNTDYYLHNVQTSNQTELKRSYRLWWNEFNLINFNKFYEIKNIIEIDEFYLENYLQPYQGFFDNYWNEYYIPRIITFFDELFEINMNSTTRYISEHEEISPFKSKKQTSINYKLRKIEKKRKQPAVEEEKAETVGLDELSLIISKMELNHLEEIFVRYEEDVERNRGLSGVKMFEVYQDGDQGEEHVEHEDEKTLVSHDYTNLIDVEKLLEAHPLHTQDNTLAIGQLAVGESDYRIYENSINIYNL